MRNALRGNDLHAGNESVVKKIAMVLFLLFGCVIVFALFKLYKFRVTKFVSKLQGQDTSK